MRTLCGIDEAGRGPLAGNLVVVGCILNAALPQLNDSKKISEKKREKLYELIIEKAKYHIVSFTPQEIDKNGISCCMSTALKEIQNTLGADHYLFDGNCNFGVEHIDTMVKADAQIPEVSAASILAKVTHDRDIREKALRYPEYGFEKHKGYGTKYHIEMIKKYGYCDIHRKSYHIKALETN